MALIDTLTGEVEAILDTEWNVRDGNVIPESDAIVLKDGAVKIEATFLSQAHRQFLFLLEQG